MRNVIDVSGLFLQNNVLVHRLYKHDNYKEKWSPILWHVSTCVDLGHLQVILNVWIFFCFLLHLHYSMTLIADVVCTLSLFLLCSHK